MGLDIYVGPLTRLYSGQWETIVEQQGRAQGITVEIVRQNPVDFPPPEEVRAQVIEWRRRLEVVFGDLFDRPLDWPESPTEPYVTDKPDWDGYGAVQLLAAHDEHPDIDLPPTMPRNFANHALYRKATERDEPVAMGLGGALRRVFRRVEPDAPRRPFGHLYGPELWLPAGFDEPFDAEEVTGNSVRIGSVPRLRAALEHLNERTHAADDATLAEWRAGTPDPDGPFEPMARFGLSVWLDLAREADARRMPMRLDY